MARSLIDNQLLTGLPMPLVSLSPRVLRSRSPQPSDIFLSQDSFLNMTPSDLTDHTDRKTPIITSYQDLAIIESWDSKTNTPLYHLPYTIPRRRILCCRVGYPIPPTLYLTLQTDEARNNSTKSNRPTLYHPPCNLSPFITSLPMK